MTTLSIGTDRPKQTVQTQIRLVLKSSLIRVYTVCTFWTHYWIIKQICSSFILTLHCLPNSRRAMLDADSSCYLSPSPMGNGQIVFAVDPVGVSIVWFSIGMTLSFLHNILWTSGWILIKFSWIYNWDITKNWLDFGDLGLSFKVTAEEKLQIQWWWGRISVFSENTVTSYQYFLLHILVSQFKQKKLRLKHSLFL